MNDLRHSRLLITWLITFLCSLWGYAEVPALINCQGRLFDGDQFLDGEVKMVLRIYKDETGGKYLYEDSNTITVVEGVYTTYLGDNTTYGSLDRALASGQAYLEVIANDIVFSPREPLISVPYALVAERRGRWQRRIFCGSGGGDWFKTSFRQSGNARKASAAGCGLRTK